MTMFIKDLFRNLGLTGIVHRVVKRLRGIDGQKRLSMFETELKKIDAVMETDGDLDIPHLFRNIPLTVFGKLLLDIPVQYPNLQSFFPSMASRTVQETWTGTSGEALLGQSLAFIKTMLFRYSVIAEKKIEDVQVLDYGCGWGRLIRLLYKFIKVENIYGVDPWAESIKNCQQCGVRGNLAISEYVPLSLPFERQFDLIFAFSVFTHLSEKTACIVLSTLRKYVSTGGVLVITIRPKEYWNVHKNGTFASEMTKLHEEKGFAFRPHDLAPIDGDITYGDASMSLAYVAGNFPHWKVESVEWNEVDPYQVILFLKAV